MDQKKLHKINKTINILNKNRLRSARKNTK